MGQGERQRGAGRLAVMPRALGTRPRALGTRPRVLAWYKSQGRELQGGRWTSTVRRLGEPLIHMACLTCCRCCIRIVSGRGRNREDPSHPSSLICRFPSPPSVLARVELICCVRREKKRRRVRTNRAKKAGGRTFSPKKKKERGKRERMCVFVCVCGASTRKCLSAIAPRKAREGEKDAG